MICIVARTFKNSKIQLFLVRDRDATTRIATADPFNCHRLGFKKDPYFLCYHG